MVGIFATFETSRILHDRLLASPLLLGSLFVGFHRQAPSITLSLQLAQLVPEMTYWIDDNTNNQLRHVISLPGGSGVQTSAQIFSNRDYCSSMMDGFCGLATPLQHSIECYWFSIFC